MLKWVPGRRTNEIALYHILTLWFININRLWLDGYIIKIHPLSLIAPHTDTFDGKHYRINIALYGKNKFNCKCIFNFFNFIVLFRPDIEEHSLQNYKNTTYLLSIGFALKG